ncbi:MAG TPA: 5-formyltetrahydrofolate cyclo-ligase, partial [Dysgonamonadaceae bacterium]|nr:5-formyltetrahydrofolate cyclo-ligase [Dysgonamonadaceae bacterium]
FVDFDSIDLIIVPGVAFDRKLNRLGRGKGYYDRLLSQLKSPKIGICFDFQLLESIPVEDWDIKMDMIVAQNEIVIG